MSDWTPDQPLRADATDRQIGERIDRVYNHSVARGDWTSGAVGIAECFVAREFAAACVGASAVAADTRAWHELVAWVPLRRMAWLLRDVAERLPLTDVGRERYGELIGYAGLLDKAHESLDAACAGRLPERHREAITRDG